MNRAFLLMIKLFVVAFLGFGTIADAAEQKKGEAVKKADPAKGEALYGNGDNARNVPACVACHGTAGNSTIAQNPKLAAQHAAYIVKQLHDFKTPDRQNPIMSTFAKALTEDEMRDIAAYLDTQTNKPEGAKNLETVEIGKKIYRAGIAEKNVPACAGCHSPTGVGIPSQFPRLGGQFQEYTAAQLTGFRAGARKNSPQMATIAKRLSDDEIQAVADYIAGLK